MRKLLFIVFFLLSINSKAQELNCVVFINDAEIGFSNRKIFETLQNAIFEYMNNTKWTSSVYQTHERINCSITINILEAVSANSFRGSLQLKVSRPVFNSTYSTSILNFNDNNISFTYEEFEPLVYNENNFDSNLVSILTFYAYTILGYQADTFGYKGGENFFKLAENVVNVAQQGGGVGWNRIDGNFTRYQLNENLLSPVYEQYRKTMYEYHLLGLDRMVDNTRDAKEVISRSVQDLENLFNDRPNTFLIRVFFDTKGDEIVDVFADGPRIDTSGLREVLSKIYPAYDEKWKEIKI
ncbi:DUF4835 family protein [Lutimonas zeaxanthinifaciens]|uniref:type IX secretion system protein PorD n=1 Tax=Lutimonas zeaxanthinifaciens TaxID=3060215 RepID=UPI00265CF995|nr:DUF4835 family protein [Lutimonas sp. YSD2104]WKK64871.1 DUF4835 family protein [Lutimonas sp. YSD2104]